MEFSIKGGKGYVQFRRVISQVSKANFWRSLGRPGKATSGKALGSVTITRGDVSRYQFRLAAFQRSTADVRLERPGQADLFFERMFPLGCNKILKAFNKALSYVRQYFFRIRK